MVDSEGRDPRLWRIRSKKVISSFFGRLNKHVVYFAGYGELGYQRKGCVRRWATELLNGLPRSEVLVHSGTLVRVGGHNGIADIYPVARELGFETSGIHPSVALSFFETHRVSEFCEHVFFVRDDTWGGFVDGTDLPAPTLQLHLAVSDEIVAIGGGHHAAAELRAFVAQGKPARYLPAEMDHSFAREWSQRAGVRIADPRGAAHSAWQDLVRSGQVPRPRWPADHR